MTKQREQLHIGTSGWSYDHWKGPFYPEGTSGPEMLSRYVENFRTVEINVTFYGLPSKETVENWKETVPDPFIFSVKASRYITHQKKLTDPERSTEKFFDRILPLGDKLGPILFQLPPRWHKDRDRLASFLEILPPGNRYVFEFRDPTWFDPGILELLEDARAACCVYDMGGELSPIHSTSDFIYVRLHGPGEKYRGNYTSELLEEWVERIERWAEEGKEIFCYFNNDFEARAPQNALLLLEKLTNAGVMFPK